jgi:hypothetical protein
VEVPIQDGQTALNAIVEFTPAGGSSIQFEDNGVACDPACYEVGQAVTVLYDPANPSNATIENAFINWIWVLVLGFLTLVFLVLAVGYIIHSYRKDRYFIVVDNWE